jgi:hypothetical protein
MAYWKRVINNLGGEEINNKSRITHDKTLKDG